jgi:hypothetical protein
MGRFERVPAYLYLLAWVSISTNTLVGSTLNITNLISPGSPHQFYRAVWQP